MIDLHGVSKVFSIPHQKRKTAFDRVFGRGRYTFETFHALKDVTLRVEAGEFVGIVRDTNEAEDVLDSFIVEDEQGEMVNVLLEDVRSIDEWVELSVVGDSLYEKS